MRFAFHEWASIGLRNTHIKTGSTFQGHPNHIVIEVGDTGCGIPAENRSSLFDPFFTTKATEAEGNEPVGTGLGLYMIARLMEPYEAKITFDSQVDVGTTFRLEIPLQRPPVPELPKDIEGSGERP